MVFFLLVNLKNLKSPSLGLLNYHEEDRTLFLWYIYFSLTEKPRVSFFGLIKLLQRRYEHDILWDILSLLN